MKLNADFRISNILFGMAMLLLCSLSSRPTEGSTLAWENVSQQVSIGQTIGSIAAKAQISPAALLIFNNLREAPLRPNMKIYLPKIMHIATAIGESKGAPENQFIKSYQIYSAKAQCYVMVYSVTEMTGHDEHFLANFVFDGKTWVEIDRVEFAFPIKWSFNQKMELLPTDATGNESCCFYIEFILMV